MANGVGVVDTSHVSEERGLEDGVVSGDKRKEEGVLVGSVEVNDLAGGEVFEEAIETPAHLPEDGERVESVDGNGEVGGELGVAMVDDNTTVEYDEAEKFEEPSDAPVEVENFEEAASDEIRKQEVEGVMMDGEEKVGDLVGGDSADDAVDTYRIDEGGAGKETATVGSSDFREDRLVDDGERKEVPDVDANRDKILGSGNHEDGEGVGPVDSNGDMAGDSNLAVVDGNSYVEHDEAEKFEEPSGDPVEVENFEEAASDEIGKQEVEGDMMDGEDKVGVLVGGDNADEAVDTNRIDEGGTSNETATLGSSDFREHRLVDDGEKKEVPVGEMVGDSGLAVADGNSTVEHDRAEKFEEPSDAPVEVDNFEEAASDDIGEQEVEGDMMDGKVKVEDLVGGVSAAEAVDTDRVDEGGTVNETGTLGSGDFREDRSVDEGGRKEVPDVDANRGDKILGSGNHEDAEGVNPVDENREMVGDSGLEVVDRNSNVEHDEAEKFEEPSVDPVEVENFEEAVSDENRGEELKDNLATLDTEHQVDESAKLKDVNHLDDKAEVLSDKEADMATGHQEEMNKKVEASLAGLDSENHVGTCDLRDTFTDLSTSGDQVKVASENGTPEMSIIDDDDDKENIQADASSLKAKDSDYTDKTAKKEEKTTEKSIMEKDAEIVDDASGFRTESSDFADDSVQVKEKTREKIEEDTLSFSAENSDFSDETASKEEADKTGQKEEKSVVEKDEKMKDDSTGLMADDSDCANDSAQEEEKTPEKSVSERIEDGGSDCANDSAREEEKTPEESITQKIEKDDSDCTNDSALENEKIPKESIAEKIEGDASSSKSVNSDFADETAKVPNNHVLAKESGKKEQEAKKESMQAKGLPEFQPTSRHALSSAKFTKPASSPAPSARPAGLGRAAPLLEPAPRAVQQPRVNGTVSQMQTQHMEDSNGETEEYDETRETLQMIRVKFLRLAHRLVQTPHNVVVAQVLYRLGLAEQLRGRNGGRVGAFSFDRASAMAEQLEAAGQEPLDFSCTIMVLGKTGVGKSATINSIFDEHKFCTNAFDMGTKKVQDVVGTVQGIKVRVIDTPGLLSSWSDQRQNVKILRSVKQFIKKTPPDIVFYLDRLDMQSRDFSDMPLLRTITEIFGPSIWFNAIVVLTHAASAPPEGPNGAASSYDMFVTQRSHVVQQAIRQAAGDMRLMNPVSLVENHSACRTNRAGQRVLPNGQVWKPHLLLLSFASKILAEANRLLNLQDSPPGKPSATRSRAPPLPFLLSSLLQSRPHLKLPGDLGGGEDDDLDESSDSDSDEESEYDELPPFTRLTKSQVALLSKTQRKAYFDELAYRERLFMKKQLKEEKRQRRMMKRMADLGQKRPSDDISENVEEESSTEIPPAPMPDLALPASFDSSNPAHRYRCLDSANQWVVRPVLDTHGWDHDVGYEGINVERFFVVKDKVPVAFSGQASKDKKETNIQMEVNSSLSHGEGKSTSMGFDLQTVGKDMSYTMRGETKFCNHRRNKATAGLSLTLLGDTMSTGVKLEDKLIVNKCFRIVMAGGAMSGRGDVAYGGSLEAQLRDRDYPLGRFLSTLGLSIMDWHGDLAIGGNVQTQIPVGRSTNLIAGANLNNRGAGQISIRLNSSEQLQIALFGLFPLLRKVLDQFSQLQHEQR